VLDSKLAEACQVCILRKDAKDLFLSWWNSFYGIREVGDIMKIEFEVLS